MVADCRFRLGEPGAGLAAYLEGHIPGAAYLDLDADLAGEPGERGRHPLPEPGRFQAAARRAGISAGSTVVAYDEAGEGGAARLWWLLRHHGHDAVAVLDGGLAAWREAGLPLRSGHEDRTAGRPHGAATGGRHRGCPGAAAAAVLLDARAPERFRGEIEPVDPVAGHIPGAVNLPFAELAPGGPVPRRARPAPAPGVGRRGARRRGGRLLRLGGHGVHDRARGGGGRNGAGAPVSRLVERVGAGRPPGRALRTRPTAGLS